MLISSGLLSRTSNHLTHFQNIHKEHSTEWELKEIGTLCTHKATSVSARPQLIACVHHDGGPSAVAASSDRRTLSLTFPAYPVDDICHQLLLLHPLFDPIGSSRTVPFLCWFRGFRFRGGFLLEDGRVFLLGLSIVRVPGGNMSDVPAIENVINLQFVEWKRCSYFSWIFSDHRYISLKIFWETRHCWLIVCNHWTQNIDGVDGVHFFN